MTLYDDSHRDDAPPQPGDVAQTDSTPDSAVKVYERPNRLATVPIWLYLILALIGIVLLWATFTYVF